VLAGDRDRKRKRASAGEWVRVACKYKWVSRHSVQRGGEVVKYCPRTATIFFRLRVSNGCRFSFDICRRGRRDDVHRGGGRCHKLSVIINPPG